MTVAYGVDSPASPDDESTGTRQTARAEADGRPIGVIVTELWENTEKLVRQEMRLALTEAEEKVEALKSELDERLRILKLEAAAKAIGGVVALAGAFTLVAAIVLLLSGVMRPWAAALLTGAVLSAVGAMLLKRDVKLPPAPDARELVPDRTIETVKTDIQAIEEATHGKSK
jgi:hypothetical protein